jgi:hypothetical protein
VSVLHANANNVPHNPNGRFLQIILIALLTRFRSERFEGESAPHKKFFANFLLHLS